jgi:hypothetical protein
MPNLKEIFPVAYTSRNTAVKLGTIQGRSTVTPSITESNSRSTVATANYEYLSSLKLYILLSSLSLAVLLVALDNTILSTVGRSCSIPPLEANQDQPIPTITAYFHSIDDVGWYGSVYLLTTCALQPLSGNIYSQYSLKVCP